MTKVVKLADRRTQRCPVPGCKLEYNHPGACDIIVKKNPGWFSYRYVIRIQKPDHVGPVMTFNGKSFSNTPPFKRFSRQHSAKLAAKQLLKAFPILKDYRVWVSPDVTGEAVAEVSGQKKRAMRGGSKSPQKNPAPRTVELDDASKKLEDFTGRQATHIEKGHTRSPQSTGLVIGELDLIGYRATRDGKSNRYGHTFRKKSRPLLAVTSDGKQLPVVGGQYEFTEAGIEDR